eukprot:UN11598
MLTKIFGLQKHIAIYFLCILMVFIFLMHYIGVFLIYGDQLYGSIRAKIAGNSDNWRRYRLGDIIERGAHFTSWRGHKLHRLIYPESIATEYIDRTNKDKDYKVLLQIINDRYNKLNLSLPTNRTLVVHLRGGDVIDYNPYSVSEMLSPYTPIS